MLSPEIRPRCLSPIFIVPTLKDGTSVSNHYIEIQSTGGKSGKELLVYGNDKIKRIQLSGVSSIISKSHLTVVVNLIPPSPVNVTCPRIFYHRAESKKGMPSEPVQEFL